MYCHADVMVDVFALSRSYVPLPCLHGYPCCALSATRRCDAQLAGCNFLARPDSQAMQALNTVKCGTVTAGLQPAASGADPGEQNSLS